MATSRITQVALIATFGLSFWGTWVLMKTAGLIEQMSYLRDNGPHLLPATSHPIRQRFTGIALIDYQLTVLGVFFWSLFDPKHPEYSLHITDFCFQFAVQYAICLIEASRPGNRGRWISYISLWGAAMQNAGVANTLPVFALLYFATSPTVKAPSLSGIMPSRSELIALPISLILSYFVPTALMRAPQISIDSQQLWLGVWQAFPLWVAILQQVISTIVSAFIRSGTTTENTNANIASLRTVYQFLKFLSTAGHLLSWGVALKALETPTLFASGVPAAFSPSSVWWPIAISPSFRIPDIGTGANLFLQYDRIGSSLGILIFAYALWAEANGAKSGIAHHAWSIVKTIFSAALIGPAGTAVALIEDRDEAVFAAQGASKKKAL